MQLPRQQLKELRKIVEMDYGVLLNDEQINELGIELLRLTRVSLNTSARRIEKDRKKETASSTIKKTRSHQQVCEITKPARQQGAFLRPQKGTGTKNIIPGGSVLTFRPPAQGGHLATDGLEVSSNPGVTASSDYTTPEENGEIVNPSCARNRVFLYIRERALAHSS